MEIGKPRYLSGPVSSQPAIGVRKLCKNCGAGREETYIGNIVPCPVPQTVPGYP